MNIAFITRNGDLIPLIEGLCCNSFKETCTGPYTRPTVHHMSPISYQKSPMCHHKKKCKQRQVKLGKKRRESSKRYLYIISPRVVSKPTIRRTACRQINSVFRQQSPICLRKSPTCHRMSPPCLEIWLPVVEEWINKDMRVYFFFSSD